jgi:hypothetical protein
MTDDEFVRFGVALCEHWHDRYAEDDLRHWRDRLRTYPLGYSLEALTAWKNAGKGHMPPKIDEIESLIRQKLPAETKQRPPHRSTIVATDMARKNPSLAHHSDASLHLLYHRQIFQWRAQEIGAIAKLRGRALDAGEQERVGQRRAQAIERCRVELIGFGIDQTEAVALAAAAMGTAEDLRRAIDLVDQTVAELKTQVTA